MPTPSLFPIFMKAQAGGGVAGVVYIETFGLEMLETVEIELVDLEIDIELIEVIDVEVIDDVIEVEIPC